MSLKDLWKLIKKHPSNNHTFSESDRSLASLTKQYNAELKRLEVERKKLILKKEIAEVRGDLEDLEEDDTEESSVEDTMISKAMEVLLSKFNPPSNSKPDSNPSPIGLGGLNITPEKIERLKEEIPSKHIKKAIEILRND